MNNLETPFLNELPFILSAFCQYLCNMRKLRMDELPRKSMDEFRQADKLPVTLLLENIRSMHNVGSVFRTADAFLAEHIYLCGYTPKPPHRDIHKTALGATETVEWTHMDSALDAVQRLRDAGYRIAAVEQAEGSISLQSFVCPPNQKLAVVFGNEVEGVSEQVLALCDDCLEIPQFGMKHSLNVSVAAGIVLWEMVRKGI
ncbi:MAG TPA: RNA methyltransferase [Puia sp.]|nr:RNA methyltransferase [Puia sp.]